MSFWPAGQVDAAAVCPKCGGLAEVLTSGLYVLTDPADIPTDLVGHCLSRPCLTWFSIESAGANEPDGRRAGNS